MGAAVSVVDWSFNDDYVIATTTNTQARIIDVQAKQIIDKYSCIQFDTYARWLPDDSILLGSRVSASIQHNTSFLQHTLWRKYPVAAGGQQAYKTFTFLDNCIHVPCYVPKSNTIVFCSGINPAEANLLNLLFITRLPGKLLYKYEEDIVWKNRANVRDIVIAETGAILGLQPTEDGRYLLVNVRRFVDPPPCFIPKQSVACRSDSSETNYNLLGMEGTNTLVPARATPMISDNSPQAFQDCLGCLDMFERKLHIDEDGNVEEISLTLSTEFELHVWDLQNLTLVKSYVGHTAFSPSDNPFLCTPDMTKCPDLPYIATGSENANIYVFHKEHSTPIHVLQKHEKLVNSVDFHPNGELMVSASDDCTIHLWTTLEKVRSLHINLDHEATPHIQQNINVNNVHYNIEEIAT
eukprot:Phypoly_transcript_06244.p1 GENE.Phypoly_transcript_06244~~Phypoly_transcript_06244.p1  ORF type:complete len:409 (+),score=52.93 Phypoly_transcript_06244:559-1785(+)